MTASRLLELHSLVSAGTPSESSMEGCFRKTDEIRVVDPSDGERLHVPPHFEELPQRVEHICKFANGSEDDRPFVHPVVRAILLHFMIGYDHPFEDGNGRTTRAVFYWSMLRSGYWLTEFLSISRILKMAPAQYARPICSPRRTPGTRPTSFSINWKPSGKPSPDFTTTWP